MPLIDLKLKKPGLFVTGTDTNVGKTLVACAIAYHLRRAGLRVGVCKPLATGCVGAESHDAHALARFAGCTQPIRVVCPQPFAEPLSPAAAARESGKPVDLHAIAASLRRLDQDSDALVVEGLGGAMAPILETDARVTLLDLMAAIGYPVVVVTRAGLGTLNHTAMTVKVLRLAGCRVAGLVVNGYTESPHADPAVKTNRHWLVEINQTPILATVPLISAPAVSAGLPPESDEDRVTTTALPALAAAHWPDLLGRSAPGKPG